MGISLAPSYFRSYEEVKAFIFELQQKYPDLVEIRDIGDSAQKLKGKADHDIWAITLTNKRAGGQKAITEYVAGIHAREIANPELLLQWAEKLVRGFGTDAEATALLNSREIDIIPIVNPDGHAAVEKGLKHLNPIKVMTRKSKNKPLAMGTDLNRNFEFHWGGPGASKFPLAQNYRGKGPASEPETQAVQRYTAARRPNQFIDWHSFSGLVLYPWGDTKDPAPHQKGLDLVARQFAAKNGYSPMQAVGLYPTSGTSDDWAYGTLGIPSFAIETGKAFIQRKGAFEKTQKENEPVLTYATKIADNPYERAKGPEVSGVGFAKNGAVAAKAVQASLPTTTPIPKDKVEAAKNRIQMPKPVLEPARTAVAGAELVLDPNAPFGSGVPLVAADGKFDSADEQLTSAPGALAAIAQAAAGAADANGRKLVYVRAHDSEGSWGPATAQWLPSA